MDTITGYIEMIKSVGPSKKLGQNFLVNGDIAKNEAMYGDGKTVLEVGPGLGMLTRELASVAKKVVAVEKDDKLFSILKTDIDSKNVVLINGDFLETNDKQVGDCDIMIANIPYAISSKVIMWLCEHGMPALLCLQKEFVEHMTAQPGTKSYSKLSVFSELSFNTSVIKRVPAGNFYPRPRVDSCIIYMRPKKSAVTGEQMRIISLLMEHKKKKIRNAIHDSAGSLGISKESALALSEKINCKDERAFQLGPEHLLVAAKQIEKLL